MEKNKIPIEVEDYVAKSMVLLMGWMDGSELKSRAMDAVLKQGDRILNKYNI